MNGTELVERFAGVIAAGERSAVAAAIDTLIAAEREACAQIADDEAADWEPCNGEHVVCKDIAAAIRARGETT